MSVLKLFLLGNPTVTVDDQPIEFERKKALALLAYLAVSGYRCSRESAMALLWSDYDDEQARAALRRTLAAITKTPVRAWLQADRQMLALEPRATLWADTDTLLANAQATHDNQQATVRAYREGFLAGFHVDDSEAFAEWHTQQSSMFEMRFSALLETLTTHYLERKMLVVGLETAQRWLQLDPYHEGANLSAMRLWVASNQPSNALQHYNRYRQLLRAELGIEPTATISELAQAITNGNVLVASALPRVDVLPPIPTPMIGRDKTLLELQTRLAPRTDGQSVEVVLQGWPGIGKTTISATLAHHATLHAQYPDGVMWVALGEQPNIRALLSQWCHALQLSVDASDTIEGIGARLRVYFAQKAVLFIVDDVWDLADVLPFRVGGRNCGTLMSTRFNDVAQALFSRAENLYKVPIIADEDALQLLYLLAPSLRQHDTAPLMALVRDLEGLPLALQVAGRLLHAEANMGWGISDLLVELRQGQRLLQAQAPADRQGIAQQTNWTIATLLHRSILRLSTDLQEKFAFLGVFAPKPATFTVSAVQAIWRDTQPHASLRVLADRGLLEPSGDGRFQMHALLVMHARSMFEE